MMASAPPWKSRDEYAATMSGARHRATMIAIARDRGEGNVGAERLGDGVAEAGLQAFAAALRARATKRALVRREPDADDHGARAVRPERAHRASLEQLTLREAALRIQTTASTQEGKTSIDNPMYRNSAPSCKPR
ncbi:MAG TPA: hypothetical protein VGX96_05795 [Candidatus Elarobacter sp.]|nr:hypothetical protein [Candidatus Elarobacter sp.]